MGRRHGSVRLNFSCKTHRQVVVEELPDGQAEVKEVDDDSAYTGLHEEFEEKTEREQDSQHLSSRH